jgi:hypothetical protein
MEKIKKKDKRMRETLYLWNIDQKLVQRSCAARVKSGNGGVELLSSAENKTGEKKKKKEEKNLVSCETRGKVARKQIIYFLRFFIHYANLLHGGGDAVAHDGVGGPRLLEMLHLLGKQLLISLALFLCLHKEGNKKKNH